MAAVYPAGPEPMMVTACTVSAMAERVLRGSHDCHESRPALAGAAVRRAEPGPAPDARRTLRDRASRPGKVRLPRRGARGVDVHHRRGSGADLPAAPRNG